MNQPDQNQNNGPRAGENDPSKAMDTKREVEQSPDPKTDQDFPGYPHYPAKEDIMDERTDSHRVDVDIENMPANRNTTGVSERYKTAGGQNSQSDSNGESDNLNIMDGKSDEIGTRQNVSDAKTGEGDNDRSGSENKG